MTGPPAGTGVALAPEITVALQQKWRVYTPESLSRRCAVLGARNYIVEGLIPHRSLSIAVGDSGIGKTALFYQMAVCVAAGVDYLGRKTRQGRVLYLDGENGMSDVDDMIKRLSRFVGLERSPDDLFLFNLNDCIEKWGEPEHGMAELVRDFKPSLVVIDPLALLYPNAEEKNAEANKAFRELRQIMSKTGCTMLPVHHIKKPGESAVLLEVVGARTWLLQARGSRALINASDVRIAIDQPDLVGFEVGAPEVSEERLGQLSLVMEGFGRVRGTIPRTYLARVVDEDGVPMGYKVVTGAFLLRDKVQIQKFESLPSSFSFKEAKQIYGKGSQATTDFLGKCEACGLLEHTGSIYKKTETAD
jgi:KaiC/GvpD/RAD55 family RecA-like ATPase